MTTLTELDLPHLVLVGPSGHGVVGYARDLADAVRSSGGEVDFSSTHRREDVLSLVSGVTRVHLHVTDRIFGSTPEQAADLIEDVGRSTRLSITLHDLPQPSDGDNFARRRRAYSRFMTAATDVVVNSHHEAQLVADYLDPAVRQPHVIAIGTRPTVVEHAHVTPRESALASPTTLPLRVLIAGYVYPGKGHLEAIDAVGTLIKRLDADGERPSEAAVVALGAPSAGHERDVEALHQHAASLGLEFRVTGFLEDSVYRQEMSGVGIPLAAHQHVSASRSMLDWIEVGRNPLVVDSPYAREMDRLRPGTMTVRPLAGLADRLEESWRDPSLTFLTAGTSLVPTLHDTALAYREWWTGRDR